MPFDPRPYAAGLRRLNEREQERTAQRAVIARARAADLARQIGEHDSTVRCVYLFGSLQRDVPRNPDFDIDLALDGGDLHRAMELAEDVEFAVDIVSIQRLPAHVVRHITTTGAVLYHRG
ncbi:MAG: nucleotidyltransferase domain-containing protein [Alkalispirochaeta sp.]